MAKKTKVKPKLKKQKPKPKKLSPIEAIDLAKYEVQRESFRHQIQTIDAKIRAAVLGAEVERHKLSKERDVIQSKLMKAKETHNELVESLKEKHGVSDIGFDLETLELGEDNGE